MSDEDLGKALEPHENKKVRELLKERERWAWVRGNLRKLSTFFPWLIGGLIYLSQGDFLEALKWWK